MTEEKMTILQKLHAIMADLDYIQKGDAKVNGQYRFVSHDQVTEKIHPLLVKHRVLALPSVVSHKQEGNRTEVDLKVIFVNVDDRDDFVMIDFFGYGVDPGDKGPGKAISYAFKYATLKALCLATGDDPDNDAKAVYEPKKCLHFDSVYARVEDPAELDKYMQNIADTAGLHLEELKEQALERIDGFLKSYETWRVNKNLKKAKPK